MNLDQCERLIKSLAPADQSNLISNTFAEIRTNPKGLFAEFVGWISGSERGPDIQLDYRSVMIGAVWGIVTAHISDLPEMKTMLDEFVSSANITDAMHEQKGQIH